MSTGMDTHANAAGVIAAALPRGGAESVAPLFLSVRETARLLGMPASTVYDLVKQGRIPHLKLGGRIRIAESVIRGFLRTAGVSA